MIAYTSKLPLPALDHPTVSRRSARGDRSEEIGPHLARTPVQLPSRQQPHAFSRWVFGSKKQALQRELSLYLCLRNYPNHLHQIQGETAN